MRIGRTVPPAAAPIYPKDIIDGLNGMLRGRSEFRRFELELRDYFGIRHCFLVSSGKAALSIILEALHEMYPDRDEVLIPAYTCYSVPSAIVRSKLKIRLCDINLDTLDFDFDQLSKILSGEKSGTSRLLAVVPIHLFGLPADIFRLKELVIDPRVSIVEDAAQAMGGEIVQGKLGTLGDAGFFSLGRGKAISTVEGGIIFTSREDIARNIEKRLAKIPVYPLAELGKLILKGVALWLFLHPAFFWFPKSLPFLKLGETLYEPKFKINRMSPFQAGMTRGWHERLFNLTRIRCENAKILSGILNREGIASVGHGPQGLIRYPLMALDERKRWQILDESERVGLGIMPGYPDCIDGISEIHSLFRGRDYPTAKKVAHELITIPIHSFITRKDRDRIALLFRKYGETNHRVRPFHVPNAMGTSSHFYPARGRLHPDA